MSIIKYLSIGLTLCAALVLLPWLFIFYGVEGLSSSPSDWAHFGSYVGGTFSSLVAALALLALLYTISQQHQQIESLKQQASKEDVLNAIGRLERDLDKVLDGINIKVNFDNGVQSTTARDILFKPSGVGYQKAIPSEEEFIELQNGADSPELRSRLVLFEVFGLAGAILNQIRLYAEGLKNIESKSGTNILSRYYQRKYKFAYARLYERGILATEWIDET